MKTKKTETHCTICGSSVVVKAAKVGIHRRPQRPFGGVLCHACLQKVMKYNARIKDGSISKDDVPIMLRQYIVA